MGKYQKHKIRIMPSKAELETIVKKAFELYDTDKSGFLEREEIKKLLNDACAELGAPAITDAQLDEVIKTVDDNGDGKFSFEDSSRLLDLSSSNNWLKQCLTLSDMMEEYEAQYSRFKFFLFVVSFGHTFKVQT